MDVLQEWHIFAIATHSAYQTFDHQYHHTHWPQASLMLKSCLVSQMHDRAHTAACSLTSIVNFMLC